MLFKVSISGQRSKRSIDIGKNTCVLGRGKDCDIDINEDLVSRKHLKISMEMDLLYIEELGSSNGSWLNSQQLLAGKKTMYNPGDIIHLGKDESGVSIVIENLCIKQAVKNTSSEKTLIFAIPAKFEKQIVEINTKLVANGAPISYPVESSQATKPFMKIVPNISEHRHGLEDKVKNLLNQEAEKLLQLAAHDSSEMKKKAELEEKQILEQAHLEAKKIIENAEIEAQKHKNNVEEELRLIKEKNKSIRFETEELLKKHKTTTAQIENVIKNLVNEEARVQQNIKSLEYGVLSIQDKIKSETALLNDIKSDTATLKKTVEMKLEEVVMEERRARARIETEILESRIQTSKIFAEAEKLQSQKYNIEAEISDLRSGKGQVEREVNELQISFKRQEYDLEKLGREYSNLSNEKLKLQASYEALINEDKKLTDKYVVRENALIEEQKQLQKEISELKDEAIENNVESKSELIRKNFV